MKRTSSPEGCITVPSGSRAGVAVENKSLLLDLHNYSDQCWNLANWKGNQHPGKEVNWMIHPLVTKHSSADYAHNLILHSSSIGVGGTSSILLSWYSQLYTTYLQNGTDFLHWICGQYFVLDFFALDFWCVDHGILVQYFGKYVFYYLWFPCIPQAKHTIKFVIGSSADFVCICVTLHFFLLTFITLSVAAILSSLLFF